MSLNLKITKLLHETLYLVSILILFANLVSLTAHSRAAVARSLRQSGPGVSIPVLGPPHHGESRHVPHLLQLSYVASLSHTKLVSLGKFHQTSICNVIICYCWSLKTLRSVNVYKTIYRSMSMHACKLGHLVKHQVM